MLECAILRRKKHLFTFQKHIEMFITLLRILSCFCDFLQNNIKILMCDLHADYKASSLDSELLDGFVVMEVSLRVRFPLWFHCLKTSLTFV